MQALAAKPRQLALLLLLALSVAAAPRLILQAPQKHYAPGGAAVMEGAVTLEDLLRSETEWLKSTQRADGAITFDQRGRKVIPYFSNLAALPLLDLDPDAARSYMEWYTDRLNKPDRFGLFGTVYDRYYEGGVERTTEDYDSADSYAATFLTLVKEYLGKTGDVAWVEQHVSDIDMIAGVIIALQDTDGLVWAKSNYKMKYLMDNSENFRGLQDWAYVLDALGRKDEAVYYHVRAGMVRQGIEDVLWDARLGRYMWAAGQHHKRTPRSNVWYPDNVAQVYPIVFGLVPADSARARALYGDVARRFPRWEQYVKDDPFPWTIMAYAAVMVGDSGRASAFVNATEQRFIATGRPEPWHSMESAFYLLTCRTLEKRSTSTAK